MHYIELRDVDKTYKTGEVETRALRQASFSVEKGEFSVVLGRSGAGKTTILNILGGMDTATAGSVFVDGADIARYDARALTGYRRGQVGFVFQFYNLVPNLTARENVELASEICEAPLDALETLEKIGLADRADNFPAQLSGGEQQRVSIARALAKNPKLLLCDEPTGALDDETGKQVLKLLQDSSRERGMTVVLITHNTAIPPIANRVIHVRSGQIESVTVNDRPCSVDEIVW